MSKSLGNLVFVSAAARGGYRPDGDPPGADRAPLPERTGSGRTPCSRRRRVASTAGGRPCARAVPVGVAGTVVPAAETVLATVRTRLADDLDAPGAVAAIDEWADAVLAAPGGAGEDAALHPGHRRRSPRRRPVAARQYPPPPLLQGHFPPLWISRTLSTPRHPACPSRVPPTTLERMTPSTPPTSTRPKRPQRRATSRQSGPEDAPPRRGRARRAHPAAAIRVGSPTSPPPVIPDLRFDPGQASW